MSGRSAPRGVVIRPILMKHLPDSLEHLDYVREQMRHRGRPKLDVVDFGHTLVLPDGVHRLFAAYELDLKPKFLLHRPTAPVRAAKQYIKGVLEYGDTETFVAQISDWPLRDFLRVEFAKMHAILNEVKIFFGVARTGRLVSVTNQPGWDIAATGELCHDLTSPRWIAHALDEVAAVRAQWKRESEVTGYWCDPRRTQEGGVA